jgi:hypothetical protein
MKLGRARGPPRREPKFLDPNAYAGSVYTVHAGNLTGVEPLCHMLCEHLNRNSPWLPLRSSFTLRIWMMDCIIHSLVCSSQGCEQCRRTRKCEAMQLCELLDRAGASTGSDYKTAKALGTTPQVVSDWRAGRRTCTAEDRALLADVAGVDPLAEVVEALLERVEGKPKEARLRQVLRARLESVGKS